MDRTLVSAKIPAMPRRIVATVLGLTLVLVVACRTSMSEGDITILDRKTSPDGQYEATALVSMGGGAAGWVYYVVVINPAKVKPAQLITPQNTVFVATEANGLAVRWTHDDFQGAIYGSALAIACKCNQAEVMDLQAVWNGHRICLDEVDDPNTPKRWPARAEGLRCR